VSRSVSPIAGPSTQPTRQPSKLNLVKSIEESSPKQTLPDQTLLSIYSTNTDYELADNNTLLQQQLLLDALNLDIENINPALPSMESTEVLVLANLATSASNISNVEEEDTLAPTLGFQSLVPNLPIAVSPSASHGSTTTLDYASLSLDPIKLSRNNFDTKAHFAKRERLLVAKKEQKQLEKKQAKEARRQAKGKEMDIA
jgi:hypothetical protein